MQMIVDCYTCWIRKKSTEDGGIPRPNSAAYFIRTPLLGKLRPICKECGVNAFDDVSRRETIEQGWDEWTIQEIMEGVKCSRRMVEWHVGLRNRKSCPNAAVVFQRIRGSAPRRRRQAQAALSGMSRLRLPANRGGGDHLVGGGN